MVHLRENELPICNLTDREKIMSWLRLVIRLV